MITTHRYTWRQVIFLSYTSLKFELFILNAGFVFPIRLDHDYVEAYPSTGFIVAWALSKENSSVEKFIDQRVCYIPDCGKEDTSQKCQIIPRPAQTPARWQAIQRSFT